MLKISDLADWGSIVGAIISILTLIFTLVVRSKVRKLRDEYFLIGRLPQVQKDLSDCKAKLFRLRLGDKNDRERKEAIQREVEHSIIVLGTLKQRLPSLKSEINKTRGLIVTWTGKKRYPFERDSIHTYYLELDKIATHVSYFVKDRKKGIGE